MNNQPSTDSTSESSIEIAQFDQLQALVKSEFQVEDSFLEHGIPTFYVKHDENSKQAFLNLTKRMDPIGFIPVLRKLDGNIVLRAVPKPRTRPSRRTTNIALFLATLGTVLFAGLFQSYDEVTQTYNVFQAVTFTVAILAILGSHEMGHKIAANKHKVEATYPYFIPGPPPIGTFGAVIQQKSLPPNKDALFDVGATGPIAGFVVTLIVSAVGILLSHRTQVTDGNFIQPPLLLRWIADTFPPGGTGNAIQLHPVAFAGYVGMIVTMLNLMPAGMLDGGHAARSFLNERVRSILALVAIGMLLFLGYWPMAMIALLFSFYRHPGPLDDVSKLTTSRKLATLALVAIFIVCLAPIW